MRADVIRMANQIAAQFRHLPETAAVTAVVEHVEAFWERRMRLELLALVDADESALEPVVRAAARRLRRPTGS